MTYIGSLGGNHAPGALLKYKMKTNNTVGIIGVLAIILASECHADLNGRDDFNDNSKDPTRWGADLISGAGLLTETNGRLEFTTSGAPATQNAAVRPWILNFGSYTQNWEIRIDVNVPQLAVPEIRSGLIVSPDPTNWAGDNFRVDLVQSSENGRYFAANLDVMGAKIDVADQATTSVSAALRIAFDANTTVLSAYYDEDGPACGYSWTQLGSTNVPANWNMTSGSVFGVWIFEYSKTASIASTDNMFGDNFSASSGPMPSIGISLAAGKVVLLWPTNAPACHLEFTAILAPPICWQAATNTTGIVGTNFTVTNTISSGNTFYRLSR